MLRVVFNILFGWMCKRKAKKTTEEQQQTPGKTHLRSFTIPDGKIRRLYREGICPPEVCILYWCTFELFRDKHTFPANTREWGIQ